MGGGFKASHWAAVKSKLAGDFGLSFCIFLNNTFFKNCELRLLLFNSIFLGDRINAANSEPRASGAIVQAGLIASKHLFNNQGGVFHEGNEGSGRLAFQKGLVPVDPHKTCLRI